MTQVSRAPLCARCRVASFLDPVFDQLVGRLIFPLAAAQKATVTLGA